MSIMYLLFIFIFILHCFVSTLFLGGVGATFEIGYGSIWVWEAGMGWLISFFPSFFSDATRIKGEENPHSLHTLPYRK